MKTFKDYLTEAAGVASVKHQEHPEDNAVKSKEGFAHAISALRSVHKGLQSGHAGENHISTKLDGAPNINFGHHPTTGKFFVATKHAAFGKTPRLATSHAEIDQHYGHSPGLAQKMHHAFEHLQKVAPKKGMFSAEYMHDTHDLHHTDHEVSFQPNTIRYHISKDSAEGKKAVNSKIGVAVHTQIHGNPDNPETLHATPLHDHSKFKSHPDVHMISPEAKLK